MNDPPESVITPSQRHARSRSSRPVSFKGAGQARWDGGAGDAAGDIAGCVGGAAGGKLSVAVITDAAPLAVTVISDQSPVSDE